MNYKVNKPAAKRSLQPDNIIFFISFFINFSIEIADAFSLLQRKHQTKKLSISHTSLKNY